MYYKGTWRRVVLRFSPYLMLCEVNRSQPLIYHVIKTSMLTTAIYENTSFRFLELSHLEQ